MKRHSKIRILCIKELKMFGLGNVFKQFRLECTIFATIRISKTFLVSLVLPIFVILVIFAR